MSAQRPSASTSRSGRTATPQEVAQEPLRLRRELLGLAGDAVRVPGVGDPPPGSRAVEVPVLGAAGRNLVRDILRRIEIKIRGEIRR
jgi:hypothetical protein